MQHYAHDWRLGPEIIAEDGIRYSLEFDAYDDASFTWRYPDLTTHVEYMVEVIDATINHEMRVQAAYFRNLDKARETIKELIDGPNSEIDRIIRSVRENNGVLSNKIKKEFPNLDDPDLAKKIVDGINASFAFNQF